MYSNTQSEGLHLPQCSLLDSTLPSLTMTISPGSTSRRYFAPIASSAQVSEAKAKPPFGNTPMQSGRKPCSSRAAMSFLGLITTIEYAPLSLSIALEIASSMDEAVSLSFVTVYAMTSVSVVAWKMEPASSSSSRSSASFVRLPLWAIAMLPLTWFTTMG